MPTIINARLSIKNRSIGFYILVFVLYCFRFIYCYTGYLKNYQWLETGDEPHIYLLGLRFFTTHVFPYWGPDIVYTSSYLSGGMQGLLVGLPLFVWPHPFAPYLFLFLMLSVALLYLSWYVSKLFPEIPKWVIYFLIALSPFTIHTGLKIVNPAYVLVFSIPFFLSFIEVVSVFKTKYIHPNWRFFWIGFAVTCVMQIHASWIFLFVLLIVALGYILYTSKSSGEKMRALLFTSIGLLLGILSLLPTIYNYGIEALFIQGKNAKFDIGHVTDIGTITYDFLMLGGFEMNSFQSQYLWDGLIDSKSYFSAVIFVILQVVGIAFAVIQILLLFVKKYRDLVRSSVKFIFLIVFIDLILTAMYLFSDVRPKMYAIIILFPLSAIFLFWFLRNAILISKINPKYFIVLCTLLLSYYTLVINISNNLPSLGYCDRAFDAIKKGDASVFESSRFIYPAPKH